jgi:hypothetical protein
MRPRGEAKKGCPQTYADGEPLLADTAHQQPEIHTELLIWRSCVICVIRGK